MSEELQDRRIRLMAFEWISEQIDVHGDVLSRKTLSDGFKFNGQRVPLVGPSGIWKPKLISQIPLTITTAPESPYDDSFSEEGLLLYRYRGTDPEHRDNKGLRKAMHGQVPLIYFHGIVKGKYLAVWPVFIIGDNPRVLTFTVAVDEARVISSNAENDWHNLLVSESGIEEARRIYITTTIKRRLHQRLFRERVLRAYREQCSLCRLKHRELLDAAHIIPDTDPEGEPIISNGISLCKLHHAAFDCHILGIRPDFVVEVNQDILNETDGPMLLYGLQQLHNGRIHLPEQTRLWPDPGLLAKRYQKFQAAS